MTRMSDGLLQVYVVSGDRIFVRGVKRALRVNRDFAVIAIKDLPDLSVRALQIPCVFIVDKSCPRALFAQTVLSLREAGLIGRALLIGDVSMEELCEFLGIGIRGFLTRRSINSGLQEAIASVCNGRIVASRAALEYYVSCNQACSRPDQNKRRPLTPRQQQLVRLLEHGNTNKEIGSALQISTNTVKFHIGKLFSRLGVHNRRAIQEAIQRTDLDANYCAADFGIIREVAHKRVT